MNANQEREWGAREDSCDKSKTCTDQDACCNVLDAEQVRRDLFNEAVRQALASQTKALMEKRKKGGAEIDCKGLLTGSELRFLLKQD